MTTVIPSMGNVERSRKEISRDISKKTIIIFHIDFRSAYVAWTHNKCRENSNHRVPSQPLRGSSFILQSKGGGGMCITNCSSLHCFDIDSSN